MNIKTIYFEEVEPNVCIPVAVEASSDNEPNKSKVLPLIYLLKSECALNGLGEPKAEYYSYSKNNDVVLIPVYTDGDKKVNVWDIPDAQKIITSNQVIERFSKFNAD